MDLAEYFNQEEHYFSESEGQLLLIEEMPFPRMFSSWMKLRREFGDEFYGTHLDRAFTRLACPTPAGIRDQLTKYGKACHAVSVLVGPNKVPTEVDVRKKMRSAAKVAGKKVSTAIRHNKGGSWVEASVETEVNVTIRSHRDR